MTQAAPADTAIAEDGTVDDAPVTVTEDVLVEDVSIDGMCGVY